MAMFDPNEDGMLDGLDFERVALSTIRVLRDAVNAGDISEDLYRKLVHNARDIDLGGEKVLWPDLEPRGSSDKHDL